MHIVPLCLVALVLLAPAPAGAADAGVVTIADGTARVLRGSVWYKLVPGAPLQEGDVVDAGERTTVQIEVPAAGTLNLVGPGALYAASLPQAGAGRDGGEFGLDRGWLKFAAVAPGAGARVRTPTALITVNDSIVVVHQESRLFEMFVETGAARLQDPNRTARETAAQEAKAGEYWTRDGDRAFASERRAPVKFVASMPRHQTDRLLPLAAKYKGKATSLAADREINLAEADPWLTGPYRRTFARRFGARLADPAFRKAVEANIGAYPEFDRVLHPEKYPAAGAPAEAAAPAPAAAGPTKAGTPPAVVAPGPATTTPAKTAPAPSAPPPATPPKPAARTGALHLTPFLSLVFPEAPEALL